MLKAELMNFIYRKYKHRYQRQASLKSLNFGEQENQYFLVSYPKSGNTWGRMLLANLLRADDEEISLLNVGQYIPDAYVHAQVDIIRNLDSAFYTLPLQIIKTHDFYLPFYRTKKVIYIVRDGRDVLTSYYHYLNTRRNESVSISDLIRGKSDSFGKWSNHVVSWSRGRCQQKHILRYEDLLTDTYAEVRKMLAFLNWVIADDKIHDAIEQASFQNLRRLEKKYGGINPIKAESDSKADFFRKGKKGDWMQKFSEADLAEFWQLHANGMRQFDYS